MDNLPDFSVTSNKLALDGLTETVGVGPRPFGPSLIVSLRFQIDPQ